VVGGRILTRWNRSSASRIDSVFKVKVQFELIGVCERNPNITVPTDPKVCFCWIRECKSTPKQS
jgi:hypothetical protein